MYTIHLGYFCEIEKQTIEWNVTANQTVHKALHESNNSTTVKTHLPYNVHHMPEVVNTIFSITTHLTKMWIVLLEQQFKDVTYANYSLQYNMGYFRSNFRMAYMSFESYQLWVNVSFKKHVSQSYSPFCYYIIYRV